VLIPDYTKRFQKQLKIAKKKHRNISELEVVIDLILNESVLPGKYKDHSLTGNYRGERDLHITESPDFLLRYQVWDGMAIFYDLGSHDDLYK
jgi:mRNA interferase YafQ